MSKIKKISNCRICGNANLQLVLDLGRQTLTGVFPKSSSSEGVTSGPLRLVKCMGSDVCGLLQLEHSYDLSEMYGLNYGYRSGLNRSMVEHLHTKVRRIQSLVQLDPNDLIIDIGSNDSTTLQAYPEGKFNLVGVDPTGVKFHSYYPKHIQLIPDFFSAKLIREKFPNMKARIITSFSMFYDLEDPLGFMKQIADVLADDGVWVFEQSYMPAMLETNSFDTVCHEHLEFYALKQICWMAERAGLKIIDVEFNDINGGSFSVVAAKENSNFAVSPAVNETLSKEKKLGFDNLEPFNFFAQNAKIAREKLLEFIKTLKSQGKTIAGLGASTKGNVLLQYCGLTADDLYAIGEVNEEKYGCYAPGSGIPIIREEELLQSSPDYLLVLPWHFKDFFLSSSKFSKSQLVFPLPRLEICK